MANDWYRSFLLSSNELVMLPFAKYLEGPNIFLTNLTTNKNNKDQNTKILQYEISEMQFIYKGLQKNFKKWKNFNKKQG